MPTSGEKLGVVESKKGKHVNFVKLKRKSWCGIVRKDEEMGTW